VVVGEIANTLIMTIVRAETFIDGISICVFFNDLSGGIIAGVTIRNRRLVSSDLVHFPTGVREQVQQTRMTSMIFSQTILLDHFFFFKLNLPYSPQTVQLSFGRQMGYLFRKQNRLVDVGGL